MLSLDLLKNNIFKLRTLETDALSQRVLGNNFVIHLIHRTRFTPNVTDKTAIHMRLIAYLTYLATTLSHSNLSKNNY